MKTRAELKSLKAGTEFSIFDKTYRLVKLTPGAAVVEPAERRKRTIVANRGEENEKRVEVADYSGRQTWALGTVVEVEVEVTR